MSTSTDEPLPGRKTVRKARARSIDVLLDKVALGDKAAFASLYEHGATKVHSVVRYLVGDAVAEDVALDVWLQVWRSAPSYDRGTCGGAMEWLLAMAHRNAVGHLRAQPRLDQRGGDLGLPVPRSSRPRQGKAALTNDQRRTVGMVYRGGTFRQTGAVLGVERRTVTRWLSEGVERMRELPDSVR